MSVSNKDLASERRTRHCRKPQRCVYYAAGSILSYNGTCDYILVTGHRRPCGFGDACTVKQTQGKKMKWGGFSREEEDKVRQLYEQGYSDPSIALTMNVTRTMVRYWRLKNDLPPNAHGGRPRKNRRTTDGKTGI